MLAPLKNDPEAVREAWAEVTELHDKPISYVASATALYGEHFYAAGGSKTCTNAFCFNDSRGGGFERFVRVGEILPSGDAAVTVAPLNFQ